MKTNNSAKTRINILDLIILVLLIVVVAVFGILHLTNIGENRNQNMKGTVTFSVEVRGADPEVLNYLEEGQTVYESISKTMLGKVVAVHDASAHVFAENHDAKTVEHANLPGKVDVTLEIEGVAKLQYPDIKFEEETVKIGKPMFCVVGGTALSGTVVGLEYDKSVFGKQEVAQ